MDADRQRMVAEGLVFATVFLAFSLGFEALIGGGWTAARDALGRSLLGAGVGGVAFAGTMHVIRRRRAAGRR